MKTLSFFIQLHIFLIYLLINLQHLLIPDKGVYISLVYANAALLILADPHPFYILVYKNNQNP